MPLDATNMPFPQPTPASPNPSPNTSLSAEPLLLEEFTHASVVAYQANADRTGLLNLYLLLAGVVATAAGVAATAALSANVIGPLLAVAAGLALAAVLSFGFFVRLIALSDKYVDALLTMDVIKEFYLQELGGQLPQLRRAFRWRLETLPMSSRASGTTGFIGSIIAVMGSFYLGAAAELLYHFTHAFGGALDNSLHLGNLPIPGFIVDAPVFLLALAFHAVYFRRAHQRRRVQASIRAEAEKFGLAL